MPVRACVDHEIEHTTRCLVSRPRPKPTLLSDLPRQGVPLITRSSAKWRFRDLTEQVAAFTAGARFALAGPTRRSLMLRSFAAPLFTRVCAGGGLALLLLAGCAQDSGVTGKTGSGGSVATG